MLIAKFEVGVLQLVVIQLIVMVK